MVGQVVEHLPKAKAEQPNLVQCGLINKARFANKNKPISLFPIDVGPKPRSNLR